MHKNVSNVTLCFEDSPMVGRPRGLSIKSLSNMRMFSASVLIRLTLVPYAKSAW